MTCAGSNHPPDPQPRHHAVERQSLRQKARHPGINALKWRRLMLQDVPEFAMHLAGLILLSLAGSATSIRGLTTWRPSSPDG